MNNISSFLTKHRNSNKPFLIYQETELGFSEVNKISKNGADFLIDLNIKEQNVAVFASNSLEYIFAYFANVISGSTNIPVNVKLTEQEILSELNYCDCNWILVKSEYTSRLVKMTEELNIGIIEINKYGEFKLVKESVSHVDRQNNSDIAVMLHTSGTTGNPKKVMLSHRNLFANTISNIRSLNLTDNDTVLVALPLFFGYCHTAQFLTHTRLGGTIVIYDKPVFSAKHFFELVQRYRVSCFTAVPTMLTMIDKYPYIDKYDLRSLRYICFGGGSVSLEMLQRLMKKIPNSGIVQTYGQTECSPRVTALLPEDSLSKIGSVGKAIQGVNVEIVDEMDCKVAPGQIGEIRVYGENITPGYYKNKQQTDRILRNNWLYTGDLAKYDKDGYLYLVGRRKNMIISGGINIYPEDIENSIKCHPVVEDVLVKPKDHDVLGEVPVAYIKLKNKQELGIEQLHHFLKKRIAQYKWPKELIVVDNFEKTPTGKTKRKSSDSFSEKMQPKSENKSSQLEHLSNSFLECRTEYSKEFDLIYSLGTTCQTAYQLKRKHLKKHSAPFDWLITPFTSMVHLLENRFENFMDFKNLEVVGNYNNKNLIVEDSLYNIKSYHDFPLVASDINLRDFYLSFKAKIDRRVKRFLQHVCEIDNILFVLNAGNISFDDYYHLLDVIKFFRMGKSFQVIVTGYSVPKQIPDNLKNISFFRFSKIVMPKQNSRWTLGSDSEWDRCLSGIKLREKSRVGQPG